MAGVFFFVGRCPTLYNLSLIHISLTWQMDLVILTDLQLFLPGNAIKQEALAGQKVVLTSGPQKCKAKEQEILLLVIIAME